MNFRPLSYLKKLSSSARGGPVWRGGPGDIVATLYDDGTILEASASADEVIGAAGNLIGRSIFDFVRREDRAGVQAVMKQAVENGDYVEARRLTAKFRLLRVRRAAAAAEITFKPIGRGRMMALIRDRGDELAMRREARAAAEQGAAQSASAASPQRAPASSAEHADMMADLSHEMKTPLNAIMGFADAMRAETFGPLGHAKYAEYIEDIHGSGAHLLDLVSSVLDYAKAEAGRYEIKPIMMRPGPIARDCIAMIRGEAEKAGLELIINIEPNLPEAMIDARAVKQILINLLSNAVKFTSEGEIELSVAAKCGAIDFTVRDTGVGMNNVVVAKLGGRFSDTHKNGVRGAQGSGLGLSLAFSLAKLHGGALKLQSAPGEGTTARLTLPVRGARLDGNVEAAPVSNIQSQFDRVNAFRRERAASAA